MCACERCSDKIVRMLWCVAGVDIHTPDEVGLSHRKIDLASIRPMYDVMEATSLTCCLLLKCVTIWASIVDFTYLCYRAARLY